MDRLSCYIIFPGVRVGRNTIIGAGVVTKDVPPYTVVIEGVPTKVLKTRE